MDGCLRHGTWPDGEPAAIREAYDEREETTVDPNARRDPPDGDNSDDHSGWHGDD